MNQSPRSWSSSLLGLALAVLAAAFVLNLAAQMLATALPILIPAGLVLLAGFGLLRMYQRSDRW